MITTDSIIEKINHRYFPITVGKDADNTLCIYSFNGSPYDGDILLAKLNMKTLELDIVHCTTVDIGLRFSEGFAFEKYDWSDLNEYTPDALLNSDISEEQFFEEILNFIPDEIEEEIGIMNDSLRNINNAIKEIEPVVKKQTAEADKKII